MTASVVFGVNAGASGSASSIGATQTFVSGDGGAAWLQFSGTTATITSASDGTNTYAVVGGTYIRDANKGLSYAYVYSQTAQPGSVTLTVNFSASVSSRAIQIFRVLGGAGAAQLAVGQGQLTVGTGTDAVTSGSTGTLSAAPAIVIAATVNHNNVTPVSAGTGFTQLGTIAAYNSIASDNSQTEWQRVTATTALAGTFTSTTGTDDYDTIALVITEASSAVDQPPSQIYYPDDVSLCEHPDQYDPAPFDFYTDTVANRDEVLPPIAPILPDSFEWDDADLDGAHYPDHWSQAPPIDDNDVAASRAYDASEQQNETDEDFGFACDAAPDVLVADQPFTEDSDAQLEDEDEPFGFASDIQANDEQAGVECGQDLPDDESVEGFSDAPLADDLQQPVTVDDASGQLEEDEFAEGFADAPLASDFVPPPDQIVVEDATNQPTDPEDEDFAFADVPLADDNDMARALVVDSSEQLEDIDEDFGSADGPLSDDQPLVPVVEDASLQPPDVEDEDFGFTDAPATEDPPMPPTVDDASAQQEEDEFAEGFADAPLAADIVDPNIISPECSDNQVDTPEDESYGFDLPPLPASVAPSAVYPLPSQVLAGVVYGPNGNDYTGTMVAGGGGFYRRR